MKCSIKKKKLPEPPRQATMPIRNDLYYGEGANIYEVDAEPALDDVFKPPTKENIESVARSRKESAEKNKQIVLLMALEGKSDAEIAAKTYYKATSVRKIIAKLRNEGHNIPERRKGCKSTSQKLQE